MLDFNFIFALISFTAAIIMMFLLMNKTSTVHSLQTSVENLKRALDEMDEQAKLVVRTDIELNKAQEELDKKIIGLYALQRLSRTISSTLEESQIFKKIDLSYLEDLGFQKATAILFSEREKKFVLRLSLGFPDAELQNIREFLEPHKDALYQLIQTEKALSSLPESAQDGLTRDIKKAFGVNSFVVAPIMPKEGDGGLLLIGAEKTDFSITEGDEELITILANQIGQAIENARLFEKTWQAHQDLEMRVEERTRELSRALEQVKKISQRKNEFVSNVSHELRTPLTSIKGYASILLSGKLGALPEDVHKRLEKINKHSDELVQFVNDLLDISRIESGRIDLKLSPLNLKSIIEEVADILAVQFKEKQITFHAELPATLPEVWADYSQLKRVFINLINNAVKYTPQGTITARVSLAPANSVTVDIQDTGCGIPANAMDKLFTEFYRVDSAMNQEIKGTGLGLALVKHIVEAHKGKIGVESTVGKGTTFSFTLPAVQ